MVFVPWMFPKTDWLMRFVARLLELKPELTPAAAVMVAIEAFDKSSEVDPDEAAQIYVDGNGRQRMKPRSPQPLQARGKRRGSNWPPRG